ncbi:MAG: sugar ABC transporter substrate-binding protein [Mesorhizobium sp.]|nr:MAG: sugar ABC transporter substrate-binding protein [Mesorhizobium sp.]
MGGDTMKRSIVAALASAALISVVTLPAIASSDKPVIALTNAYYGNTWRHQMVEAFEASAKEAKAAGQIADYIVMNGDGSVAQQNSQIAELILDFEGYKATQAEAVFKMLGGKGNVIQVRGVKGSAPDNDMFNAQQSVLAKYPDIKVVATVYGQATASVAQAAIANVLPSLPHVDAVLGQGGSDDVGIAQAFVQYGGDYAGKMPIIEGGGGTDFVKWWADENAKNGYQTVSMNTTPGIGGAAFWLGLSLLKGAKAPKMMIMPVATVDASNLKEYAKLPGGQIISPSYSLDWVKQNLLSK